MPRERGREVLGPPGPAAPGLDAEVSTSRAPECVFPEDARGPDRRDLAFPRGDSGSTDGERGVRKDGHLHAVDARAPGKNGRVLRRDAGGP